jgi:hypothetical protein
LGKVVTEERTHQPPKPRRGSSITSQLISLAVFGTAALGVIQFYEPPRQFLESGGDVAVHDSIAPLAFASRDAFGRSGEVRVLFALPGDPVVYPMELRGDPSQMSYAWIPFADTGSIRALPRESTRPLETRFEAPRTPGFYRLAVVKDSERVIVDGPALSVMVPFSAKLGNTLNGYRIGTYIAERLGRKSEATPPGFVEIDEDMLNLPLSKHLRLADFVTHDNQDSWPRYAAVNGRLLDKIELVVTEIAHLSGRSDDSSMALDVHSGFRTPIHNRRVRRSARDSRHQYGDAADIAIDTNGDGKITFADTRLVARAVEVVEAEHPDLVGGMGLYNRGSASYVHIDARGKRARWRG